MNSPRPMNLGKYLNPFWQYLLLIITLMADCQAGNAPWIGRIIEMEGGQTDAVHICQSNICVINFNIKDKRVYKTAHRDAIQLIPPRTLDRSRRSQVGGQEQDWVVGDQMTGTVLENVTVEGSTIRSPYSPLQGIFGADGLFVNLRLLNNHIQTAGDHSITINGLLSGEISGNTLQAVNGKIPAIRLYPARIGGNLAEEGVAYILDFADEGSRGARLRYGKPVIGDNRLSGVSGRQFVEIADNRFSIPDTQRLVSFGLTHFRYYAFMDRFSRLTFGEYRRQNGGRDFARLKAWLEDRVVEYTSGKRIMVDALPSIPAGDERRVRILPVLREALTNAVNSHALDHVSLSNFPETPVRAFVAKQIALQYGDLQPLGALDGLVHPAGKVTLQQMGRRRQAILKYLLSELDLSQGA